MNEWMWVTTSAVGILAGVVVADGFGQQPGVTTELVSVSGHDAPASPAGCGPDEATALRAALRQLPAEPVTGRGWENSPLDANYDPCADLSTILVMIQGGTGSSPVQALMFHRGSYLGTATSKAHGFTDLDRAASSADTVVLSYRSGQSCTACGDGTVTKVRYHWDGTHVQMLDPPPPVTG